MLAGDSMEITPMFTANIAVIGDSAWCSHLLLRLEKNHRAVDCHERRKWWRGETLSETKGGRVKDGELVSDILLFWLWRLKNWHLFQPNVPSMWIIGPSVQTRDLSNFTESDKKWLDFGRSIVCEFSVCLWNIPKNHVLCASVAARNFQDLLLSWNGEMGSVRMKWILSFEGPLPKDFYPKGDLFLIIDNQSTTIFQMKNPITYHFQKVFWNFRAASWRVWDPVTSA